MSTVTKLEKMISKREGGKKRVPHGNVREVRRIIEDILYETGTTMRGDGGEIWLSGWPIDAMWKNAVRRHGRKSKN